MAFVLFDKGAQPRQRLAAGKFAIELGQHCCSKIMPMLISWANIRTRSTLFSQLTTTPPRNSAANPR
jgi:hypothetical protein